MLFIYYIFSLNILIDYLNGVFLDGKEGDKVSKKGKLNFKYNIRLKKKKIKVKIWGIISIFCIFVCLSDFFFFLGRFFRCFRKYDLCFGLVDLR